MDPAVGAKAVIDLLALANVNSHRRWLRKSVRHRALHAHNNRSNLLRGMADWKGRGFAKPLLKSLGGSRQRQSGKQLEPSLLSGLRLSLHYKTGAR